MPPSATCAASTPGSTARRPQSRFELAKGNVVLIDFWTYTCVNCIRTLPFLVEWQAKYGDRGLTIIGVHSPEFEFEKVRANVEQAIEQYGIEYVVAQDNDFRTWARLQQSLLAGQISDRPGHERPLPAFRRRRLSRNRAGDPASSSRKPAGT